MSEPPQSGSRTSAPIAPRLGVVVVACECRDLLDRCLASVRAHAGIHGEAADVWVVDNASTDGSAALVADRYPEFQLIANPTNIGFSAANNLALRQLRTDYVLLLNPDCELHAGTTTSLLGILEERQDIGVAGCKLVRPDGSLDHAAKRGFPTIAGALGHFLALGRASWAPAALSQYRAPQQNGPGPVDAINGAFMLMRRRALDDVGLFDEGYWLYMEDLDLCIRFAQRGWLVWYEPSVSATHLKGGSSGTRRAPRQNRAFHYGMYRFYRKFYAAGNHPALNLAVYAGIAGKLAVSMTRNFLYNLRAAKRS